jgi:hypothetical protein
MRLNSTECDPDVARTCPAPNLGEPRRYDLTRSAGTAAPDTGGRQPCVRSLNLTRSYHRDLVVVLPPGKAEASRGS